jgi:protein SCO1/2
MRTWALALIAALAGLALAAAGWTAWRLLERPAPDKADIVDSGLPAVGGPFALVDHRGQPVTDEDFRGGWILVYFGYTYCPDICPTGLFNMAQALDDLGPAADDIRPIFVTIDPERDTVEALAQYVNHFHPRLVGLTGTPEQIAETARAYRVYYARAPTAAGQDDQEAADYLNGSRWPAARALRARDRSGRNGGEDPRGQGER